MAPTGENRFCVLLPQEPGAWLETVSRLLEPMGVRTVLARSGHDALHLLAGQTFHAAVLDTDMPLLGGMQVVRLMRESSNRTPAILLSPRVTTQLMREALQMSVFSVLGKPVDVNVLLDSLARVLRRYYESRWPGTVGEC